MYKPTDKISWNGRVDPHDGELGLRWHQIVEFVNLSEEVAESRGNVAFLGFCCDEGVRRNQGRVGAADGPRIIRQAMSSFADHLPGGIQLVDCGDVLCTDQRLEEAQAQLGKKVEMLLEKGYKPILLGGGHETAYGHFLGLRKHLKAGEKLGIINLDAHFDLRSYAPQSNSGSPFLQIADDLAADGLEFHYLCLGIQEYGNTRKLFQNAAERNVANVLASDLHAGLTTEVQDKLRTFISNVDQLYLSIDLDVFAAAYAPGVSAPTALGLTPQVVVPLLEEIIASGKLLTVDVVELNPSLDIDNQTARLTAALIYQLVQGWRS